MSHVHVDDWYNLSACPSIIDNDVKATKNFYCVVYHSFNVIFARHVRAKKSAVTAHPLHEGVAFSFATPRRDYFCPSARKTSAMRSPIPLVAPVTIATFPSSVPMIAPFIQLEIDKLARIFLRQQTQNWDVFLCTLVAVRCSA
jgi:hypothetical protein